jgi:hypothetical protein
LVDRAGKGKQPLLDHNRHFADEVYHLAALLKHACIRGWPARRPCSGRGQIDVTRILAYALAFIAVMLAIETFSGAAA